MKIVIAIIIFCLVATSCSNSGKVRPPQGIICEDTMVEVITDVHIVQSAQRMNMVIDSADTNNSTSFNYVWKKHHLTESEYQKNMDFYTHNPAVLDSIYEKVLNNLSKQKAVLQGKLNPKKH